MTDKDFEEKVTHSCAYVTIGDTPEELVSYLAQSRPGMQKKIQAANVKLD